MFRRIIQRTTRGGTAVAGVVLVSSMLLVVITVIARLLNIAIPGGMELMQLMMAIVIAFALVYAALQKAHVVVRILTAKFPVRIGAIASIIVSFLSLATWGLMSFAAAQLVYDKGLREVSETLEIPYSPFRIIFIFGLLLFALSFVVDMYDEFKKVVNK
ncbi:MAG: TRAP transporter small permease subunit [Dehalococcoidia bacterium]